VITHVSANVAILHWILKGHVGVYWHGGALFDTTIGQGITLF